MVMEVKFCPVCGKLDDPKKSVCDCGYARKEGPGKGKVRNLPADRDDLPLRFNRGRIFTLAGFVVLSAAAVFAFFNYDAAVTDEGDEAARTEPAALFDGRANLARSQAPRAFEGIVTRVITGEVLTVRDNANTEFQVRLVGIVAPKLNDVFGREAKENLSEQILGKTVRVVALRTDEGGIVHGQVIVDEKSVGLEQIRNGFAKHDLLSDQAAAERDLYAEAEEFAKNARSGIWSREETAAEMPNAAPDPSREVTRRSIDSGTPIDPSPESARTRNAVLTNNEEIKPPSEPAAVPQKDLPAVQAAPAVGPSPAAVIEIKPQPPPAGTATERIYIRGPRGGCYYINSKGSKSYVDHSRCP